MTVLYLDLETFSDVPIAHGVHAYAERAEILLFAYAIADGPARVWDRTTGGEMPAELHRALTDPKTPIHAHNSAFDRTILDRFWRTDHRRWRDTRIRALAHSLPGHLGELCGLLQLPADKAKDKEGRQLVLLFCKPRPATAKLRRADRDSHPAEWARFVEYARLDVEALRELDRRLPRWNAEGAELALWHLDQTINDRGVLMDRALAEAAVRAVGREQKRLAQQAQDLTGGAVQAATQRDALLKHILETHGVELPDLQKSTLERRVEDPDLPPEVRELLALRLQAATSSTAKYKTLLNSLSPDDRLRGTLQFCGASRTGRWSGRLFQPQNLPRPSLKAAEIAFGIEALKADGADLLFPSVMDLTRDALRGCVIAPPGKKLVVADLANIEGRVLAWLAGEDWKLQAFADYDAGQGADLYKLAYARSFGIAPEAVTKDQRQVGKVMELAMGYEGGVGAFLTFAAAYGIDLEAMAVNAWQGLPQTVINEANSALAWTKLNKRETFGLSDRAWLVCDSFKRLWRQAHPQVTALWANLQAAAVQAVEWPGQDCRAGLLNVRRDANWLRIRLPSGRCLCYPSPRLDEGKLSYKGVNQYSRKWGTTPTYGGKLVENATQAVARDILAASLQPIEDAGYRIVLTVHDEVITEAPDAPAYNPKHLAGLMAANPPWAKGLPLAAAGFEATRYRKD